MKPITPFSYTDKGTPQGYECYKCPATGVRLYREYNTFCSHQVLRCRACTVKNQPEYANDPMLKRMRGKNEHCIGSLVAAVPTEDGTTFWGFTSVPQPGVDWWNSLPKKFKKPKKQKSAA